MVEDSDHLDSTKTLRYSGAFFSFHCVFGLNIIVYLFAADNYELI